MMSWSNMDAKTYRYCPPIYLKYCTNIRSPFYNFFGREIKQMHIASTDVAEVDYEDIN